MAVARNARSLRNVVGISLGGTGIVVCIVALILIWVVDVRLSRATGSVVDKLNDSLVAVQGRVVQVQERVQSAKLTSDDVEKSIREWTEREAGERVALRLNAAEKVDRASAIVQQAGEWLEIAESSAELVNKVLSSIDSSSGPAGSSALDQFIKEISGMRAQLTEATQVIAGIRERLSATGEGKLAAERVEQAVQLIVRLGATFSSVESRLQGTTSGLSDAQARLEEVSTRTQRWIHAITIIITLLILLMAAGQVALCRLAWSGLGSA